MVAKMSYDLSDGLAELRGLLVPFDQSGVQLEGKAVRRITKALKELRIMAQRLEHEVSRHRWNEAARAERAADEKLLAALAAPGSNVVLFPGPEEVPFSDGWPGGRSA